MEAERGRGSAGGHNAWGGWNGQAGSPDQFDTFGDDDPDAPVGWTNSLEIAERDGRPIPGRDDPLESDDETSAPSQVARGPLSSRLYEARRAQDPDYDPDGEGDEAFGDELPARDYTPAPPDAPWTSSGPLLDVSLHEYDRLDDELKNLYLLLKQCDREVAHANHRKTIEGSKVRQMEEKLGNYGRQEISDIYHAANEAEKQALMINEQRELLLAKIAAFERFRQYIRRTVNVLMDLPAVSTPLPLDEPLAPPHTPRFAQTPPPMPQWERAWAPPPNAATAPAEPFHPDMYPTTRIDPPPPRQQQAPPPAPQANHQPGMGLTTRLEGTLGDVTMYLSPDAPGINMPAERLSPAESAALRPAPDAFQAGQTGQTGQRQQARSATGAESRPYGVSTPLAAMTVARVIQSEEELRQRVAQRLHDGPTQSLANLVLTAEICERIVREDPQRALSELAHLKRQVNEALQQTRAFIFELRPMTLDDLGLMPTLRRYAANVAAQKDGQKDGLKITVQAPKGEPRLAADTETAFFRVAQEAITNAVTHGKATEIVVTTLVSPDYIRLMVDDNGEGFDVDEAIAWAVIRGSTGIASMRERADILGGKLRIESVRGRGSRVELVAPHRPVNTENTTNTPGAGAQRTTQGAPRQPPQER